MTQYSVVGKRSPRLDALDKVTGKAVYSTDISLPDMLCGKILRSPHAHANIRRLDVSKARALEGVKAVITTADVPGQREALGELSMAKDKVLFFGQPLAAVAAVSPDIAEKALGLIEVDYAVLPLVLDAVEAMKPTAPVLYPGNNHAAGKTDNPPPADNIVRHMEYGRGDIAAGFSSADVVIENTFRTQRVHQGYLETRSTVASAAPDGKITVWTDSQGVFRVRDLCSGFLGIPPGKIRVMSVEVGGAFGGKNSESLSPICALLSLKSGRPVKMAMTRQEDFIATHPAPPSIITIKIGANKIGMITAASVTLIFDVGAIAGGMPTAMGGSLNGLSPYRWPNLKVDCYDVFTNKAPSGSYRAPQVAQVAFAVESQIDLVARAIGMDPLEFRLKNASAEGDLTANGNIFPKIGFKETLEKMQQVVSARGKLKGENRGRGIACGMWFGAGGGAAANINVNNDGSVVLIIGAVDLTGSRTSIAQIAAEELGIAFEKVSVVIGDTDSAPQAGLSAGSQTTRQTGMAVVRACKDIKDRLLQQATVTLKVKLEELEFVNGQARVTASPDKFVSLADLAKVANSSPGGPVIGKGVVGTPFGGPMFAVHMAEVEVDKATGKVKLLSYVAGQDVGFAINPTQVEGQMQGAVTQGVGFALYEGYMHNSQGIMQNPNFLDYRMPTSLEVPFLDTVIVEVNSTGPFGARGAGEPPITPCLAAIANAIHSATGVRLKETPMNPEAVFWALHPKQKTNT